MAPVFEDYLKNDDLNGYMTALWRGYANGDKESIDILLYFAIKTLNIDDALDLLEKFASAAETKKESQFVEMLLKNINKELNKLPDEDKENDRKAGKAVQLAYLVTDLSLHPKEESLFYRFGGAESALLRAYINNVGREPEATFPAEEPEEAVEVPDDLAEYWRSNYSNSDACTSQMNCYTTALPYAEKGDPYAMYIVGYMLYYGIKTKYSSPSMEYLKQDKEKSLQWLRLAADKGIDKACWLTACIYFERFQQSNQAEDEQTAYHYIEKGAELGSSNCIEELQKRAETTGEYEKAFIYLKRLAEENGSREHMLQLADWYAKGKGTDKDEKKAFELVEYVYKHSSLSPYNSCHEDAAGILIHYLKEGIGCERNPDRAWSIYNKLNDDNDRLDDLLSR